MDFVARAGAIIDRAHRIAGILLICVIILGTVAACQVARNTELNNQLNQRRIAYPVIVVPDATSGVYSPTEEERLISLFADFVTQSFNSYTPENIQRLYSGLKPYMGPALLADSAPMFEKTIRDVTADRRSSFFIPNRTVPLKVVKRGNLRDVTITGTISSIVGGTVAEDIPVDITMTFQKGFSSPANVYGFTLVAYHVNPLVSPQTAPTFKTANP